MNKEAERGVRGIRGRVLSGGNGSIIVDDELWWGRMVVAVFGGVIFTLRKIRV